jgi:hypothetical protein
LQGFALRVILAFSAPEKVRELLKDKKRLVMLVKKFHFEKNKKNLF